MNEYTVFGLTKKKKLGKILGSIKSTSKEKAYKNLNRSGSVLDTPLGSKYESYYVMKKKKRK